MVFVILLDDAHGLFSALLKDAANEIRRQLDRYDRSPVTIGSASLSS